MRDYDKLTPAERRRKAEGRLKGVKFDGDPAQVEAAIMRMVERISQQHVLPIAERDKWEQFVIDHAAKELTRMCPEAPPDTREDET